jgi:ribosomal protein L7/L12
VDIDDVLAELRSRGASIGESLKVIREVEHLTLGEAKVVVDESRAWADQRTSNDALRDEVIRAFGESDG